MSLASKLSARFILLIFGRFIILSIGLVTTAILTRYLGPEGFGNYRAAVAYLGLVVVFADLGLGSIFVREISRQGVDQVRVIGNALTLRLLLACAIMFIAVLLSYFLPFNDAEKLGILAGSLGFVAYSLHLLLFGVFQQKLKQQGVVLAEVSGGLVLLASIIALTFINAEPAWFVGTLGTSYIFTLLISVFFAKRLVPFRLRFEFDQWSELVRSALPLAGAGILGVLYVRGDSVLLALLHSPEAVGIYGVPVKLSDSILGIMLLFVGLFAPLLARSASTEPEKFIHQLNDAFGLIFLGGVGAAVMLNILAVDIIAMLAGPDFIKGVPVLRLLSVFMVFHSGTLMLREAVVALDLQSKLLPGYAITFIVAFVAYYYLIPPYAGVGAAAALIISELFLLAFVFWIVKNGTVRSISIRVPLLGIISGLSALIYLDFVTKSEWHWIVRSLVGILAYICILFISRAVPPAKLIPFFMASIRSKGES